MKNINLGTLIGVSATVFVIAIGAGILSGYLVKRHKQLMLSMPILDMSNVRVIKERNTQDATYYAVEGITANTKTGDSVDLVIHNGVMSFSPDKNGRFASVPSNSDGNYFISASNARTGVKAKDLEITGFVREPWDPACVPYVDAEDVVVRSVVGVSEYHYNLVGLRVSVKPGTDVRVYIKNCENGDVFFGELNNANGTWSVVNVPATASGTYMAYASNVTDEAESEGLAISGFNIIKPVNTPSPTQLEQMYRTGNYDIYKSAFRQGYSFVFSGAPITGLKPHTNQEICTRLKIHAWDDVRVLGIETDCLGRIIKVYIRVVNS